MTEEVSELQTNKTETLEEGADSATATGENLEENNSDTSGDVVEGEAKEPSGFTKRIHQKHHQAMEATRRAEAAEAKLAKIEATALDQQRPVIPEIPDPYDENFDKLIVARDKAIQDATAFDANQQQAQRERETANQQRVTQQNAAFEEAVKTYAGRAGKLNITPQALAVAGQTVAAYGMHDAVVTHILADEQGPLITTYLAQNPDELEKLGGLNPMRAAVYLETTIKSLAGSIKQKNSDLPAPADTLGGGGAAPSSKGPVGATYE